MLDEKYIIKVEYDVVCVEFVLLKYYGVEIELNVLYVVEIVCVWMVECYGEEVVYMLGMNVYIMVDFKL